MKDNVPKETFESFESFNAQVSENNCDVSVWFNKDLSLFYSLSDVLMLSAVQSQENHKAY